MVGLNSELYAHILADLPPFVFDVLDKTQGELGFSEQANCINAAFNFHDPYPHRNLYTSMEFLSRIQTDFVQLPDLNDVEFGDLIVIWFRNGGAWDKRSINVHEMDKDHPDFPYGLVFDHVAVRLTKDIIFHKPNPKMESRYQIESWQSASAYAASLNGYELTAHRK